MKKYIFGLAIILLAFFFRFNNLNWDENFHLHPDERFLTMVGTAMKLPTNTNQYFDQKTSLMNPSNVGYNFFVYGRFPLILTKYLASVYKLDNYNDFTILGRQLSALFDLLIVILVIKTTKLLIDKSRKQNLNQFQPISIIPYWAGFFYAIAVLPIQLSHFFAVDTFLNFFVFGSFYFSLNFYYEKKIKYLCFSTIFFGLAMASKITALFILPLNLFLISLTYLERPSRIGKLFLILLIYFGLSYLTLRLADPYLFQNSNIFNPSISKLFIDNIKSLQNITVKNMDNWFPPMVQWLNKNTVQHSLVNNIVFGLGIPFAILALIGFIKALSWKSIPVFIILFWVFSFFTYQSIQATPTLRYFIIIYPFLAIFASIGIDYLMNFKLKIKGKYIKYPKYFSYIFILICILILLIWPVMFSSIYSNKNSRVEASEWIYKNLPDSSYILSESWDDSLPLGVANNYGKRFTGEQLPVFDPDTPEKWQKINTSFKMADYYILSSNRGWGSIPTVPQKYPLMSKFYKELLSGLNSNYKLIKKFTSYPKLEIGNWKLEISDDWSDESFTVYDHQQVLIYKNVKKL
jgi:hypothetical protein